MLSVLIPSVCWPQKRAKLYIYQWNILSYVAECTSGLSVGTASCHQEVSVLNINLNSDNFDSELCTTLQWIAASELGIPTVYFRNSQESRIQKFLQVTQLVQSKSWKVGDIFSALILHCKIQEQGSKGAPSFFDWILELG
ncbi:hypothetical protein AB205_0171570 [Aquarana catesbeiana]|uniref:A-kinase anchor 110kDa C-terminal domain-containing protein n=1 Tax=Aquarana catesbeiana TaxID=8400 RepID=A0A2G9R702_AQUCT|nr:hypothetical protein AB205_0171570 [Aquarana catesbeiana]